MTRSTLAILKVAVLAAAVLGATGSRKTASQVNPVRNAPPRTPWGDPDLQGTWTTDDAIGVPIERPVQFGRQSVLSDQELADGPGKMRRPARHHSKSSSRRLPPAGGRRTSGTLGERGSRTIRQTSFVIGPAGADAFRHSRRTPNGAPRAAISGASAPGRSTDRKT